jgi:hypothetical protein
MAMSHSGASSDGLGRGADSICLSIQKIVRQITDPNSDEFAKFFDIYVESMPASERKA